MLLLLLILNKADLDDWLERQCQPKIKLGWQKFRQPTGGREWHFVGFSWLSTCIDIYYT